MGESMASPRILHLDTERGWRGGQLQVLLLHRGLRQARVDSTVLCRADEPLALRLAAEGLPMVTVRSGPGFALRAAWTARQFARGETILHAHASAAHGIARLAACGRANPLITTRRLDFALSRGAGSGWKYGQRTTYCIAISHAVATVLEAGGVGRERIVVIPDGVDPSSAAPHREGLPKDRLLVLCVAAFASHKGHHVLLEAWRRVIASGVTASLLLAGRGDLEAIVRRQATDVPHVHFLGWREDIANLWASVDVAVLASLEEGLGSTLIDAQLAGVPVVATTAGGIPEVVAHGHSGLLVAPGDPAALAGALQQLLSDEGLRRRLSAGARATGQTFLASTMVQRYHDLYLRIAAA